eukprot:931645-Amphidinium_carterae.3
MHAHRRSDRGGHRDGQPIATGGTEKGNLTCGQTATDMSKPCGHGLMPKTCGTCIKAAERNPHRWDPAHRGGW